MANAVSTWSPVIMTVLTPASLKSATALAASGLAGSRIPTMPRKVSSSSCTLEAPVRIATARVRSASPDNTSSAVFNCLM